MAEELWTIERLLDWTQKHFRAKGIDSARLDAELLLAAALAVTRVHLYTHYDQPIGEAEREVFRRYVRRRAAREPVALILGTREFYGRDFAVTRDVLIPRPETEHLVDAALEWMKTRPTVTALDVGTGTGCIGITLARERPELLVVATDISAAALSVARRNAEALGVSDRITFLEGDLLAPVRGQRFGLIVSNPPYVEETARGALQPEVEQYEPHTALFAGPDGLAALRMLVGAAPAHLEPGGLLAVEIGAGQSGVVTQLMIEAGLVAPRVVADLAGHGRVVLAQGE